MGPLNVGGGWAKHLGQNMVASTVCNWPAAPLDELECMDAAKHCVERGAQVQQITLCHRLCPAQNIEGFCALSQPCLPSKMASLLGLQTGVA